MEEKKDNSEHDELTALIKRTDKENPKPEDLAAMKSISTRISVLSNLTASAGGRLKKQSKLLQARN
jgi:hypothetical protein